MLPSLNNKTWLIPLLKRVWPTTESMTAYTPIAGEEAFEAWLTRQLEARGYTRGLPADLYELLDDGQPDPDYSAYALFNAQAHHLQIGFGLLRRQQASDGIRRDALMVFAALAWSLEAKELAEEAYRLLEADLDAEGKDDEAGSKARSELAANLGKALVERALDANDPLLGHPFHQILLYHRCQLFARLMRAVLRARKEPGGQPQVSEIMRAHGLAETAIQQVIGGVVGLALSDGEADVEEQRLVTALVNAARLSDAERAMIEVELARTEPIPAIEIGGEIRSATLRRLLVRLLLLKIHHNGKYDPVERKWVMDIATMFGIGQVEIDAFEVEALTGYEQHGQLLEQLSLTGMIVRMRQRLDDRIETVVRSNMRKLVDEVKETSELGQLLLKAGEVELSEGERVRVREQLLDVCRTVPALAIFAVPGGAILLPLAIKHLPFQILPSNFARLDQI